MTAQRATTRVWAVVGKETAPVSPRRPGEEMAPVSPRRPGEEMVLVSPRRPGDEMALVSPCHPVGGRCQLVVVS